MESSGERLRQALFNLKHIRDKVEHSNAVLFFLVTVAIVEIEHRLADRNDSEV